MTLENGRPGDEKGRLEKEIRVYDLLDRLQIEYQRVDHEEANTMEACLAIDGVLAPAVICKNLFLTNSAKTEYYLLMICANKKFKTAEVSKQIGSSRLSFGDAEKMLEFLDITPGSVSVMGLMNDHNHQVNLLVDEDVLKAEYFGCHPCVNTSSLKLKTKDVFEKVLPELGHEYQCVTIKTKND
ncbi:MAG: prolyl-tRNA synthetase associated domain-containing protein [Roseburia sp.]